MANGARCGWHPGHGRRRASLLHLGDAARSGTGMDVELSAVPQREEGMTPYELLLSESQERDALVGARGSRGGTAPGLRPLGARA